MSDEFSSTILSRSVNGCPYKVVDGQWVPDEEARLEQYAREASEQKRKDELIWACRSRIALLGK